MSAAVRLRPYCMGDAAATANLFHRAVREGARAHYSEAERQAWSPAPPEGPAWAERLQRAETLVAESADGTLAGFMSLTEAGVLDLAFVAPEWMGRGVAGQLHDALIGRARARGLTRLTTEASHLARPFFARRGWQLEAEQQVERRGVRLTNFRMSLRLEAG